MAKDPAFLFYPNDYLGGTMGMTFEEKGAYIELLMLQFNRGHMTSHMIGHTVGHLWDNIKDKFIQDQDGLYYNVRLDQEKEKRATFTKSRRNNLNGVNQHTPKEKKSEPFMDGHTTSRMENENENGDTSLKRCAEISLKDERWVRRNKTSQKELEIFIDKLEKQGIYYKPIDDFKKHFANWKDLNPPELTGIQTTTLILK